MNWHRVHLIWMVICLSIAVSAALGLMNFPRVSQMRQAPTVERDYHPQWRTYGEEE
jgi:hypothetical protein